MDNILVQFLMQLAVQAPVLLVYLAGMVLALVFWRRCPGPCTLTLIAMGLLLLTSTGQQFMSLFLIHANAGRDSGHERLSWMLSAIAIVGSFVRALAYGLLLFAVFAKREPPAKGWD